MFTKKQLDDMKKAKPDSYAAWYSGASKKEWREKSLKELVEMADKNLKDRK